MLARFKSSFVIPATAWLLCGLALSAQVQAAVDVSSPGAERSDQIAATNRDRSGGYSLRNTDFTVEDLQKMQDLQKRNAEELDKLKRVVKDQAQLIDELKRGNGAGSSSSGSDLSDLKRNVSEQDRSLDKLARQVDDLKRSAGSSSSASDLSGLKRDVGQQQRDLDDVKRSVSDLSRKVK